MRVLACIALAGLLLAGCAQGPVAAPEGPQASLQEQAGSAGGGGASMAHPGLVPSERAVVHKAVFREELRGTHARPGMDGIEMPDGWADRDVVLSFHGVQPASDEWGRLVPSLVFRYEPMVLEMTDLEFTEDGMRGKAQYVPEPTEYLFDAADGRFMGHVRIATGYRSFTDPATRSAYPHAGYAAPILYAAGFLANGGDPRQGIQIPGGRLTFTPIEDDRPVDGECEVLKVGFQPDKPSERAVVGDDASRGEPGRHLVCLAAGSLVPLWTFTGTSSRHIVLRRDAGPFDLPALAGKPLPPVDYPRHPWVPLAGSPVVPPLLVPPSTGSDWAHEMAARAEALTRSPDFIRHQVKHGGTALTDAWTGLPLLPEPPGPATMFPERSWLTTSAKESQYSVLVSSGNPPSPVPDHVADPQGHEFDPEFQTLPDSLPDLVAIGEAVTGAAEVVSIADPAMVLLHSWFWTGHDMGDLEVMWTAASGCFGSGGEPVFVSMSGVSGRLLGVGRVVAHDHGCSWGGGAGMEIYGPLGPVRLVQPQGVAGLVAVLPDGEVLPSAGSLAKLPILAGA